MVRKVLCVAEKPSIAKAVASHLGGHVPASNVPGIAWLKNYEFEFTFNQPWGHCKVVMTSVAGHLTSSDFDSQYRNWSQPPPQELFDARIVKFVENVSPDFLNAHSLLRLIVNLLQDKKPIAKNIETQARHATALFIWTDCDREGEHIGTEIRDIALRVNANLQVKRARFSNIERAHVIHAAKNPVELDQRQANAVSARMELDLRVGSSFTRMLTLSLKPMIENVQELKVISYGSCQFPTLGFVVDRYFKVKNFVTEAFWKIQVVHIRDGIKVTFNWRRVHLFDRMVVTVIFEKCINDNTATVSKLQTKPTSKWKPLPLTTVELQKMGSRFLRMDSQKVMKIAEELYQKGFISYPRTETDQFDRDTDLTQFIDKQTVDEAWGGFAQSLLDGAFQQPRSGRNNDKAHPPIHPVNHATNLGAEERRVYEFVVRRFLACCSEDAKGESSTVELTYGGEIFTANGLMVLQRNYLDVYPYDKWESSRQLPIFTIGETFVPTEANINEGKTSPPGYLTEPELIGLMDANGIGTDATMAEHIAKIKERSYVMTQARHGGAIVPGDSDNETSPRGGRGGGRARARGRGGVRGRGGSAAGGAGGGQNSMQEFIPTTLGVALIEGYDNIGFATSLSKPFLRKEMELQMKAICAGTTSKNDVVHESLEQYREVFYKSVQQMEVLKNSVRKYVLGEAG